MAKETDKPDSSDPNFRKLEVGYQECVTASRFVVGTRFNYFISFTTFFFLLVGALYYVWTADSKTLGELKSWFLLIIALFGFYMVGIALILEKRAAYFYKAADNRAADLEGLMGIKGGIRQIFIAPVQKEKFWDIPLTQYIPLTHTASIRMFYGVVAVFWATLVIVSGCQTLLAFLH